MQKKRKAELKEEEEKAERGKMQGEKCIILQGKLMPTLCNGITRVGQIAGRYIDAKLREK